MAASSAEAAKRAAASLYPPSSTFAELLRRSKFATYDPAIRQTYSSPPEAVNRGDWGLKRPITLRRKNAFITFKSYEHRAFFVEWNHGENQVRFIRRMEELNQTPTLPEDSSSAWISQLGSARHEWLIDSDFCPEEDGAGFAPPRAARSAPELAEGEYGEFTADLAGLGKSGAKSYGTKRTGAYPTSKTNAVQPNIYSMEPRRFKTYIKKIRALRPAFIEWLKKRAETDPLLVGKRISDLRSEATLHREFLAEHWNKEFHNPLSHTMAQQPHRFGGLTYAHYSQLDTKNTTQPQPGLVLQERKYKDTLKHRMEANPNASKPEVYVTSFAGLAAKMEVVGSIDADIEGDVDAEDMPDIRVRPLFKSTTKKLKRGDIEAATMRLRVSPGKLFLHEAPNVVGPGAQGLKGVRIRAEVEPDDSLVEEALDDLVEDATEDIMNFSQQQTLESLTKEQEDAREKKVIKAIEQRKAERAEILEELRQMPGGQNNLLIEELEEFEHQENELVTNEEDEKTIDAIDAKVIMGSVNKALGYKAIDDKIFDYSIREEDDLDAPSRPSSTEVERMRDAISSTPDKPQ